MVAVGGQLSVENLKLAYGHGIFPWPTEGQPMLWFCPDPRGILDFNELKIPQSLRKWARKNKNLEVKFNTSFSEVIRACAEQKRPGQEGTWILPEVIEGYQKFEQAGYVKCLEVWQEQALIGAIYGVDVGGVFSAESMFYRKSNASKFALWKLIEHLQTQGRTWMDLQMITPVSEQFGGKYIPRQDFLKRLGFGPGRRKFFFEV